MASLSLLGRRSGWLSQVRWCCGSVWKAQGLKVLGLSLMLSSVSMDLANALVQNSSLEAPSPSPSLVSLFVLLFLMVKQDNSLAF